MKRTLKLLTIVAVVGGGALGIAGPATAEGDGPPIAVPCSETNVDCSGLDVDVPNGRWCAVDVDGDQATPPLVGTTEGGKCVCPDPEPEPEPTTSTVPATTSTTVAPTTSTVATPPSTDGDANLYASCDEVIAAGRAPLTEGDVGYRPELDGDGDGTACETDPPTFVAQPTTSGQLPVTGSNTGALVASGVGLCGLGAALVAVRRRMTA